MHHYLKYFGNHFITISIPLLILLSQLFCLTSANSINFVFCTAFNNYPGVRNHIYNKHFQSDVLLSVGEGALEPAASTGKQRSLHCSEEASLRTSYEVYLLTFKNNGVVYSVCFFLSEQIIIKDPVRVLFPE